MTEEEIEDINLDKGRDLYKASTILDEKTFNEKSALFKRVQWLDDFEDALDCLLELCSNKKQRRLIIDLIERIYFPSDRDKNKNLNKIAAHIINEWHLFPQDTRIVSITADHNPDGAQAMLQSLKNKLDGWGKKIFINNIGYAIDRIMNPEDSSINNVIIIDDFCGSGETFITEGVEKIRNRTPDKQYNLYGVFLTSMQQGIDFIRDSSSSNQYTDIYSPKILTRGISDYFQGKQLNAAIKTMQDIEGYLEKLPQNHNFGYSRCEALFGTYDNIPNNVFPIFWWDKIKGSLLNKKHKNMFHRVQSFSSVKKDN